MNAPARRLLRTTATAVMLVALTSGTALAAKTLLTGADVQDGSLTGVDVQDDSLTGADINESSLGTVPSANLAQLLSGYPITSFVLNGAAASGALDGTYPGPGIADDAVGSSEIADFSVGMNDLAKGSVSAPKMISGAAATNIWGKDQWAPPNATQRGYVEVRRFDATNIDPSGTGGFESVSYPVPLAESDRLEVHVIHEGESVPDGCGGDYAEPYAAPGNLCIFYDPAYAGDTVHYVSFQPEARYGFLLRVDLGHDTSGNGCDCAVADVIWAMTPPIG